MCFISCSTTNDTSSYSWIKNNCIKTFDNNFYTEYTDTTTNIVYSVSANRYGGVNCSIKN